MSRYKRFGSSWECGDCEALGEWVENGMRDT